MARLIQLSDLHCPAADPDQAERLAAAVRAQRPDIIVISGDLTRDGDRHEFESARAFLEMLGPAPKLVLPGNHDVPVWAPLERFFRPFRRFRRAVEGLETGLLTTAGVHVVALNSAVGFQWRVDWSLGVIGKRVLTAALKGVALAPAGTVPIIVSHHPLREVAFDLGRSRTLGGPQAVEALAHAGARVMLHGHLHRAYAEPGTTPSPLLMVGAGTALSDRERGGGSSFMRLEIQSGQVAVYEHGYDGQDYTDQRELISWGWDQVSEQSQAPSVITDTKHGIDVVSADADRVTSVGR